MIKSQILARLAMLGSMFATCGVAFAQMPVSVDGPSMAPQSADSAPDLSASNSADTFSDSGSGAGHRMQANNLSPITSDRAAALMSAAGSSAATFGPLLPSSNSGTKPNGAFDGPLQGGAGHANILRAKMANSFGSSSSSAASFSSSISATAPSLSTATTPSAGAPMPMKVRASSDSGLEGIRPIRFDLPADDLRPLHPRLPDQFYQVHSKLARRSGMGTGGSATVASSSKARNYETPVYSFMMKHETGQKASSSSQPGARTTAGSPATKKSTSHGAVIDSLLGNSAHH